MYRRAGGVHILYAAGWNGSIPGPAFRRMIMMELLQLTVVDQLRQARLAITVNTQHRRGGSSALPGERAPSGSPDLY